MCLVGCSFALLDALLKFLARDYPVIAIAWVRYLVQTILVLAIFVPKMKWRILHTANPRLQLLRGSCLLGASLLMLNALSYLPLTETTAVLFLAPIFITLLSGPILKEKAKPIHWMAVALGFAGVLIIVRPGGGLLTWAILLPVGAAICNATYQIVTRLFHSAEHPATTNLFTGLVGVVVLAPAVPFVWKPVDLHHGLVMVVAGIVGATAHYLITKALEYSQAVALAPYSYTQLVWAAVLGYVMFGALPDRVTWLGIAVIACSGLLISFYHLWNARRGTA